MTDDELIEVIAVAALHHATKSKSDSSSGGGGGFVCGPAVGQYRSHVEIDGKCISIMGQVCHPGCENFNADGRHFSTLTPQEIEAEMNRRKQEMADIMAEDQYALQRDAVRRRKEDGVFMTKLIVVWVLLILCGPLVGILHDRGMEPLLGLPVLLGILVLLYGV